MSHVDVDFREARSTSEWESRSGKSRPVLTRTDDSEIRRLVERWATAVHTGDMARVLVDHPDDIVMLGGEEHRLHRGDTSMNKVTPFLMFDDQLEAIG